MKERLKVEELGKFKLMYYQSCAVKLAIEIVAEIVAEFLLLSRPYKFGNWSSHYRGFIICEVKTCTSISSLILPDVSMLHAMILQKVLLFFCYFP